MEQLSQTLQSYLNLREALLRKLTTKPSMGFSWYIAIGMSPNTRRRRQLDPATWRFDELIQLAKATGTADGAIHNVKLQLAQVRAYIETLSDKEKQRFYRTCQLTPQKMELRHQDQQCWRVGELERMVLFLRSAPVLEATGFD